MLESLIRPDFQTELNALSANIDWPLFRRRQLRGFLVFPQELWQREHNLLRPPVDFLREIATPSAQSLDHLAHQQLRRRSARGDAYGSAISKPLLAQIFRAINQVTGYPGLFRDFT